MPAELTKFPTFVVQHVWQIEGAQTLKEDKATITSPKFSCADDPDPCEFELQASFGSKKSNYLSVHLNTFDQSVTKLFLQVSVIDHEGRLLKTSNGLKIAKMEPNSRWGYLEMLALNLITESNIAILCSAKYLPDKSVGMNPCTKKLQSDLIHMFESAKFTDVTFLVQGEEIAAHKSVLASRSAYFEKMFDAEMQESATNRVEVTDVDPATFKAVLRFLYGGVMEEKEFKSLAELIVAADKYGIDDLKNICESTVRTRLQFENIVDALLLADMHNCASLLRDGKVLFKALAKLLKKDQSNWNKLAERPSLLMELLKVLAE